MESTRWNYGRIDRQTDKQHHAIISPFFSKRVYKNLDLSCKTDLGSWGCFGRENPCLITKEIQYKILMNLNIDFLVYFIYSAIRQDFSLSRMTTSN